MIMGRNEDLQYLFQIQEIRTYFLIFRIPPIHKIPSMSIKNVSGKGNSVIFRDIIDDLMSVMVQILIQYQEIVTILVCSISSFFLVGNRLKHAFRSKSP